jgi:hypothetical protein
MKKLSIEECKEILNADGKNYTDADVEILRNLLYTLAEIELEDFRNKLKNEKEVK